MGIGAAGRVGKVLATSIMKKGLLLGWPRLYKQSGGRLDVYLGELGLAEIMSVDSWSSKTGGLHSNVV